VLEASLLTEIDRRERAVSKIERIKKEVRGRYLAFASDIAGIRNATEVAAAIVPKARELDELLLATATEVGNAIDDLLSDLDRRMEALRVDQAVPELPSLKISEVSQRFRPWKESEAWRKANDHEDQTEVNGSSDFAAAEIERVIPQQLRPPEWLCHNSPAKRSI
jgi:hypothetical protein